MMSDSGKIPGKKKGLQKLLWGVPLKLRPLGVGSLTSSWDTLHVLGEIGSQGLIDDGQEDEWATVWGSWLCHPFTTQSHVGTEWVP